ncbi:CvpA family protein [Blattabacterium cuenoti]|uniref:CvpA family protein n=1 Tax=Blattabacterium cuenoti TaxID=1653831 RepID=UPI00163D10AF|nr:CvpA family protein [Blattabacterium cuenoti]
MLDIIIIILVLYGGYHGYRKGLISQLFIFMISLILIFKGFYVFNSVKGILKDVNIISKKPYILMIYSIIISLFSIILIAFIIKKIIELIIIITWMKPLDRLGGGVLGMIKYFFCLSICILFLKEANKKIDLFPYNFFQNSFEKKFQFLFYQKGSLLNKLKELYLKFYEF